MAKRDDIPKTDPSEIGALIKRLKQSKAEHPIYAPRNPHIFEWQSALFIRYDNKICRGANAGA
jgi:hypothetical protein